MTAGHRTVTDSELGAGLGASVSNAPSAVDLAMSRYADGDDTAFAEVFTELSPRLQAFLRRLSGSQELADDLTQETFLRMHRARGSFTKGCGVTPWAYAIARNCYVSHARSRKFAAERGSLDVDDHVPAAGPEASAEESLSAREIAAVVERTLSRMSVANREAFVLIRFEGQSVAAAAQILGTTEGAVKLRAFRAYETFREAIARAEQSRAPEAAPRRSS